MSTDSQSSIFTWLAAVSSPQAVLFDTGLPLELPRPPVGPLLASTAQRKRRLSNSEADEENNYARPPKLPRGRERLTRHALRELQGKGAGVRKQQKSPTKPSSRSGLHTPSTTSGSSASSEPKLPNTVQNVRASLARHGMYINEGDAWESRCAAFKSKVLDMFDRPRPSRMQETSAKAISKILNQNYTQNEKTVSGLVLPRIFKDTHTVVLNKRNFEGEVLKVVRSYEDEGLQSVECPVFVKDMVPGKDFGSTEKAFGLTDPVPDMVYGAQQSRFPKTGRQPPQMIQVLKNMASGVDWPFFVVENKSCERGIAEAENQAIRDGATIVNARLRLQSYSRQGDIPVKGADPDIFVFSCVWTPDLARMFVHWHETLEDGTSLFHMTKIRHYLMLDDTNGFADLRRDVHSIFDWGLLEYVPAAEKMYQQVVSMQNEQGFAEAVVEHGSAISTQASSS